MKTFKSNYPRCTVWWRDITTVTDRWRDNDEELPTCARMVTEGFLIKKTKDTIYVAGDVCEDGSYHVLHAFPKGVVYKMETYDVKRSKEAPEDRGRED